jgi:hypothetical protein
VTAALLFSFEIISEEARSGNFEMDQTILKGKYSKIMIEGTK